jgi:hypothetical protein
LVYSIYYSIEEAIENMMMIEASQRMLRINNQDELGGMSPTLKEIFRIRNKDSSKCSKRCRKAGTAFESKGKTKGEAIHIEDIEWLVTEKRLKRSRLYCI